MRSISWARKPVSALPLLVSAVLVVVGVVVSGAAAAVQSPAGCNADNSVVNIARSQIAAVAGETVTFTVSSGNETSADGCDIVGRSITLTLPNGTSQVFGPFDEPNGTPITVRGQLPYVANVADLVAVGGVQVWPALATWTGTQLDGFDSASTGSKATAVIQQVAATTLTAAASNPTTAHAGDVVTVRVTETNSGQVALHDVTVTGAPCGSWAPVGVFNGDLAINASQDFSCQVTVGAAGTDTGWSADGHGLDTENNQVPDTNEHQQGSIRAITPGVSIVKYTNGADANDPNAAGVPDISAGGAVTWRYDITNTGATNVAAADVVVTDNVTGVTPSCAAAAAADANHVFDPGETWQCTATGTALDLASPNPPAGTHIVANSCSQGGARTPSNAYTNLGTVTIPGATASDPSSYCNPPRKPGVSIVKYTNGADANDPNAAGVPDISAGGAVTWRYDVTNTGATNVAAADVVVTDNVTGVTPSCAAAAAADANHVFDPGETWQCTATGTALDLASPNPPAGTHIVANSCTPGWGTDAVQRLHQPRHGHDPGCDRERPVQLLQPAAEAGRVDRQVHERCRRQRPERCRRA